MFTLGAKIKRLRNNAEYTQKELADKCMVNEKAISRYETDVAEPSYETLRHICEIFDVDANYLLDIHPKKNNATKHLPKEVDLVNSFNMLSTKQQRIILDLINEMNSNKRYNEKNNRVQYVNENKR